MDYLVELNFAGPGFVAVPNAVVDDERIGADALAVLVYLARLSGSGRGARIVRVGAICSRFRLGKDKWQRIARELRAVGALTDNFGRSEDGRNVVRSLVVGWPQPAEPVSRKTRLTGKTCEPENPAHTAENPAEVSRKTRLLKKEQTAARGGAPKAQPPRAAGCSLYENEAQAGGYASSRGETSPPASSKGAESAHGVRNGQEQAPDVMSAARKERAALAASLGLRVLDQNGQWSRPLALVGSAEKQGQGGGYV